MTLDSQIRSTTVLAVLREGRLAVASDGQVTVGQTIVKQGAQKVRLAKSGDAIMGFAGGAADALALTERFEAQLESQRGNVRRAAVALARDWRTDRALLLHANFSAPEIASEALRIASEICIYTNAEIHVVSLP